MYELVSLYKDKEQFIFSISGITPQSEFYNDNVKTADLSTKYSFKEVINDKNLIKLVCINNACQGSECIKKVIFQIDTNQIPKLCKVRKIHKETKEETILYRLFFPFYLGYENPANGKEMIVDVHNGLNLQDKEKMDQIIDLLSSIYTPKFACK